MSMLFPRGVQSSQPPQKHPPRGRVAFSDNLPSKLFLFLLFSQLAGCGETAPPILILVCFPLPLSDFLFPTGPFPPFPFQIIDFSSPPASVFVRVFLMRLLLSLFSLFFLKRESPPPNLFQRHFLLHSTSNPLSFLPEPLLNCVIPTQYGLDPHCPKKGLVFFKRLPPPFNVFPPSLSFATFS